ncbi:hypothetical protein P3W53_28605 [Pseudomonas denitrificans (nom. rej.)]|nr:hypothetical protein [Pseudomonas denitrificans (nom. rej.)]
MQGLASFLTYGAIGLGLALALLSYRLLRSEQAVERPRPGFLRAIYIYMCFSLVLVVGGLVGEHFKPDAAAAKQLQVRAESQAKEIEALKTQIADANNKLQRSQLRIGDLMNLKSGKLRQLIDARTDPAREALLQSISEDLANIDALISNALASP